MAFKDRVVKINEAFLQLLEKDTRPAEITEEPMVTRVDFRSRGWLLSLYLGMIFLVSFLFGLANAVFTHDPFTVAMARLWPEALFTCLLLAVTVLIYFTKQGLQISQTEVVIERGFFPFRRPTRIPVKAIRSVRIGSFYADAISLAGQDRYVALKTDQRTYRVAWGLSAEQCEAVAETIRKRTNRLPDSG
jgi:hypothetical protein